MSDMVSVEFEVRTIVVDGEEQIQVVSAGAQGPAGPAGPVGSVGPQGPAGVVVAPGANGSVMYAMNTELSADGDNFRYDEATQSLVVRNFNSAIFDGGNF